jgi:hypothetical protein
MSNSPFILTLCDAGSNKVEGLRSSLHGHLYVLETYSSSLGTLSKIVKIRDFLNAATDLSDDTIIVFLDAYDVLCIRFDLDRLVSEFRATGQDLIAGAETVFCHHHVEVMPFFLENYMDHPARYLNSGFIMAYKWAYLRMLNHISDYFIEHYMVRQVKCDQRAISTFMLENSKLGLIKMDMDSQQKFCYTHTYDNNPLGLEAITSYFVHVTWLALDIQAKAYQAIKDHFLPGC